MSAALRHGLQTWGLHLHAHWRRHAVVSACLAAVGAALAFPR